MWFPKKIKMFWMTIKNLCKRHVFSQKNQKNQSFHRHQPSHGWLAVVCQIFGFFGFFGKTHAFCIGFSWSSRTFWFFWENSLLLQSFVQRSKIVDLHTCSHAEHVRISMNIFLTQCRTRWCLRLNLSIAIALYVIFLENASALEITAQPANHESKEKSTKWSVSTE